MRRGTTAETAEQREYRIDLYWWLDRLWAELRRHPALADIADDCGAIFRDGPELADVDSVAVEDLERIRERINALPEDHRRRALGGFVWRPTPPTRAEARKIRLITGEDSALDCVTIEAGEAGVFSERSVSTTGITGVVATFPAGTSRADVLAALLDMAAHVQRNWPDVQNSGYALTENSPLPTAAGV
jgi:hypothetical protein